MSLISSGVIALGVSMDAFAVAITKGLKLPTNDKFRYALIISFSFGLFQAIMPLIGLLAGNSIGSYIAMWDHWVAFFILALIGGKMAYEGIYGELEENTETLCLKSLFLVSLATSIDALMIGISLPFFKVSPPLTIVLMGIVTFALSMVGVLLGDKLSAWGKRAEVFGGLILIGLGAKILIQHLFFMG